MVDSRTLAVSAVGAAIGGVVGYLFFTERGRTLRRQLVPALEEVEREIDSLRSTIETAARVANEGWGIVDTGLLRRQR